MFLLIYSKDALNDLAQLDRHISKRITAKLHFYAQQKDVLAFAKTLQGFRNRFRFRVGEYRVVFQLEASGEVRILKILRIKNRKDIYEI